MPFLRNKNFSSTDGEQKAPCKVNINFILLPREAKRKTCFCLFKKNWEKNGPELHFDVGFLIQNRNYGGKKVWESKKQLGIIRPSAEDKKIVTQSPSERLNCNFLLQFLLCIFFSTGKEFLRYFWFFIFLHSRKNIEGHNILGYKIMGSTRQ